MVQSAKSQLSNYEAYGFYRELVDTQYQVIDAHIYTHNNINDHFDNIMNILSDGIETDYVQNMMIHIIFTDGVECDVTICEYLFALIFFTLPLAVKESVGDYSYRINGYNKEMAEEECSINSDKLFYVTDITQKAICKFIDNKFVKRYRTILPLIQLNQTIDIIFGKFRDIRKFQMYLMNTINLEDTIYLMRTYKDFYDAVHCDASGIPIEEVKNYGMKAAQLQVDYITNSDHCLRDSFRTGEGVNVKQFKEVQANIGPKPNGKGGVFPTIINSSFITGGLKSPQDMVIESSIGRQAQILSKNNVGFSGNFARLLGLNCMNTFLHEDPTHICHTKNFIKVYIKDEDILKAMDMRFYRKVENGIEYLLDADKDKHLIGETLYFRSPMTCESFHNGHGICYRCYGNLAYVNRNVNVGKIAAEEQSSRFTQRLLSAKHLLESSVIKLNWAGPIYDLFEINFDAICMRTDVDYTGMLLKVSNLETDEEYDDIEYNYSVSAFTIIYPDGKEAEIHTADSDNIYIQPELADIVIKLINNSDNDTAIIPISSLDSIEALFRIHIKNNELQATMDKIKNIINVKKITSSYNKDSILEDFCVTNIKGGIKISSVHFEVILANLIRSRDDLLRQPDWSIPHNDDYQILTLNAALMDSPYLQTRLLYSKLNKILIKPSTYKVDKGSMNDIFFHTNPIEFLDSEPENRVTKEENKGQGRIKKDPFIRFESSEDAERWLQNQTNKMK